MAIQTTQLCDRIGLECRFVDEVLVAVDDHAKLRPPVTEVIVRNHAVPKKSQDAGQGIADHRRADVAHVHRFGDVGCRVVDHEGLELRGNDCRDTQAIVGDRRSQLSRQVFVLELQIDEARSGDLGRVAYVVQLHAIDDLLRNLQRLFPQCFLQRQGDIGLVITVPGLAGLSDPLRVFGWIVDPTIESGGETRTKQREYLHLAWWI